MHRIDGPGATVDNKFTEGDPVGGVQATVVTDDFLNDVQEELVSILAAAGVAPAKGTQDQVLQSFYRLIQAQKSTAFSTTGTAAALTLTPVPAITAYAAPQRFRVKFSQNSTPTSTINVSGKGGKPLKQYDASGAKVPAVYVVDQLGDIEYDGADFVLLDQLPAANSTAPGIVSFYAASTPPDGYLKANGAIVSRTTYAALFAVVGVNYGPGDGSTTFRLPDLRGEFIRGWDDGRGIDVGRAFATAQADEFKSHVHYVPDSTAEGSVGGSWVYANFGNGVTVATNYTQGAGGTETRPRNIALLACIKY